MIKTAAQILAEIGDDDDDDLPITPATSRRLRPGLLPTPELYPARVWVYPKGRRKPGAPPLPCRNADKGCEGMYMSKQCAHGWCRNCYARWKKWNNSWYHSPNYQMCTKKNCFMGHNKDRVYRRDRAEVSEHQGPAPGHGQAGGDVALPAGAEGPGPAADAG